MELQLAYGLLLVFAGAYDLLKNKVPDLVSSGLWLFCIFLPAQAIGVVVATFGTVFFINAAYVAATKKIAYGWADILILPTYAGFVVAFFPGNWPIALSVMLALPTIASGLVMAWQNKGQPLIAYLAFFFMLLLVFVML